MTYSSQCIANFFCKLHDFSVQLSYGFCMRGCTPLLRIQLSSRAVLVSVGSHQSRWGLACERIVLFVGNTRPCLLHLYPLKALLVVIKEAFDWLYVICRRTFIFRIFGIVFNYSLYLIQLFVDGGEGGLPFLGLFDQFSKLN